MPTAFLRCSGWVGAFLFLVTTVRAAPPNTADASSPADANDPVALQLIPLAPDREFVPTRVGNWAEMSNSAGAPSGQRAIYSNTLGQFVVPLPANTRFADDVTFSVFPMAPANCRLRGLEFPVVGKVNPAGTGGPFTMTYALYTNCPNSVPWNQLPTIANPGLSGQVVFTDDQDRLVQIPFGDGPALFDGVSSLWLGVTFNRGNVGLVVGAPPLEGFSCDLYDYPGAASQCNSNFGGFPDHPYGSMNLEVFGDSDTCTAAHVGYRTNRPAQPIINLGANLTITDDIVLGVQTCRMVGYEVAVKGVGEYTFDLRSGCDSAPIARTQRFFNPPLNSGPNTSVIARQLFNPPIEIPNHVYFAASVNNTTGGVILSGQQACVGSTQPTLEIPVELGGCAPINPPVAGQHGSLNVTIFCDGEAPTGACCDMYFLDSAGEAVCRDVPQMNCAFPPRFSTNLRPFWRPGDVCDPDPFNPDCGLSCCCKPDGTRENLTYNQCQAVEPLTQPRQWQRGLLCGISGQTCPNIPCLARPGECTRPRICPIATCGQECHDTGQNCPSVGCDECPPVGCDNASCCTTVCLEDDFCCLVEWDEVCADLAVQLCCDRCDPGECAPSARHEGATLLTIPDSEQFSTFIATESDTDPGFGCYKGDPGHQGFDTHWYKFIAPPAVAPATRSMVDIRTCQSSSPANDSLVQLFAVADPTNEITQCNSLIPYGCNDDFSGAGCTRVTTLSRLCARELIPGTIYYVLVGGKTRATIPSAAIRLDISQVNKCITELPDDTNDYCPRAIAITDGVTPFNLARTNPPYTLDLPESCALGMTADMWFNYTATCTGTLNVHTCGPSAETSPDTNLAIYSTCPSTNASAPLACSQDTGGDCGLASSVTLDAVQGQEFTIRLGDNAQNLPSGNLTISCTPADCPAGAMELVTDGILGLPADVIDPRRPHDPADASALLTTQTFQVTTTRDAQPSCFSLCETASVGTPNFIATVTPGPIEGLRQRYTVTFARPITPGAKTTISYSPDSAPESHVHLYSHPGNVNADSTVNEADITALRNALGLQSPPPFASWTFDLDRSSAITPADLLEAVDLQNGAGSYILWSGTSSPVGNSACP